MQETLTVNQALCTPPRPATASAHRGVDVKVSIQWFPGLRADTLVTQFVQPGYQEVAGVVVDVEEGKRW